MSDTKNILAVPLAIIVSGALIAGAVYFTRGGSALSDQKAAIGDFAQKTTVAPVSKDDHILGNPEAKVVIVEYSDTECPYCKNFHNTMNQLMDVYGKEGDVAWVYRHFPLTQIHPKAVKQAEATECAAELGGNDAFWNYLDEIFVRTPSNNRLEDSELSVIAKDVGLDVEKFDTCLSSGKYNAKVNADYQSGIDAGVEGTPYSLVVLKGTDTVVPINGAQPYSVVKQVVDSLIGN